jgi:hypothetical protein
MNQGQAKSGFFQRLAGKLSGMPPAPVIAPDEPPTLWDPMDVLEALKAGKRPDYCLYIGPTKTRSVGIDMEKMLIAAFAPLPFVPLDGYKSPLKRLSADGPEAADALATLSKYARIFLVVPTEDPRTVTRLRKLREANHLWRTLFLMPDAGAFGVDDWQAAWQNATRAANHAGLGLPPYTGGGWLFRYDLVPGASPRAATFKMIAHPNVEKVMKAIEAVCQEMVMP